MLICEAILLTDFAKLNKFDEKNKITILQNEMYLTRVVFAELKTTLKLNFYTFLFIIKHDEYKNKGEY